MVSLKTATQVPVLKDDRRYWLTLENVQVVTRHLEVCPILQGRYRVCGLNLFWCLKNKGYSRQRAARPAQPKIDGKRQKTYKIAPKQSKPLVEYTSTILQPKPDADTKKQPLSNPKEEDE